MTESIGFHSVEVFETILLQIWFKVAFRYHFRELFPFVKLPHVSNRTHKIRPAFWGRLVCRPHQTILSFIIPVIDFRPKDLFTYSVVNIKS